MPQNYYAADFDPWVHNIRSIGTMLQEMPALRAQAQLRQAQGRLYQAHTEEAQAQAGHFDAQTQDLIRKGQMVDRLQQISGPAEIAVRSGKYDAPEVQEFSGIAAGLMGLSGKDAQVSMRNGIQTIEAMKGNARTAGLLQNPSSVENNEANNERQMETPMVVPQGGIAIDKGTGKTVATGAQKLSIGQRLFMPRAADVTTIDPAPAAEGTPEQPKTPELAAIRARMVSQALAENAKNNPGTNGVDPAALLKQFDQTVGTGGPAGTAAAPAIPQGAVDYLKTNPHLRDQFDQKYGVGSAAKVLGQ